MKTLVVGLNQYLDRDQLFSDQYVTYRDIRAFFREGVIRAFTPNLSAIAVTTCLVDLGYDVEYLDLAFEFGIPFTAARHATRNEIIAAYFATHPYDNVFVPCVSSAEHLTLVALVRIIRAANPDAYIGV